MAAQKITFIITSVIYFPDKKLSYHPVRSVFTPAERVIQTMKTIESIRQKIPSAKIVLVEMGMKKDIGTELINAVDKFIYTGSNLLVKWAASGKHKGLGEAAGLIAASAKIKTGASLYFKISGRYFLNDDFNAGQWKGQGFFFRKYGEGISTRLYAFGGGLFDTWKKAMIKSVYHLYKGKSIHDVLLLYINSKLITEVKSLGVSGFIAPDGGYISE